MEKDNHEDEPDNHLDYTFGTIVRALFLLLFSAATHMRSALKKLATKQFFRFHFFERQKSLFSHNLTFALFEIFLALIAEPWLTIESLRF